MKNRKHLAAALIAALVMAACLGLGFHLGKKHGPPPQPAASSPAASPSPAAAEPELLPPQAMESSAAQETIKDPVCGNYVDPTVTKFKAEFKDHEFYFDSEECRAAFAKDPPRYLMHVKVNIQYKPGVEPLPEGSIPTEIPAGEEAPSMSTPGPDLTPVPGAGETPPGEGAAPPGSGEELAPPTAMPAETPAETPAAQDTVAPGEEVPPPTAMPPVRPPKKTGK